MKKILYRTICFLVLASLFLNACKKEKALTSVTPIKLYKENVKKNSLDSLVDTIYQKYGVKVLYQFDSRVIDPITFFTPTSLSRAKLYTKYVVEKMWLAPLAKVFPKFLHDQKPIELLVVGSAVHFNSISSPGAAGAGLNAQYYRLGMADVDNMTFTRNNIRTHMNIVYHEHAHQLDAKYGRGYLYDRVSAGDYYQLRYAGFSTKTAQEDGFFTSYGGFAPEEDFATSVESMIRYPKSEILRIISLNPKLEKKYHMVYNFYLEKGLDLHRMHDVLDSVAKVDLPTVVNRGFVY